MSGGTQEAAAPGASLAELEAAINRRIAEWDRSELSRRLWSKDPTIWPGAPAAVVTDRLGWLDLPERMRERIDDLEEFAEEAVEEGARHLLVVGTGGSSRGAAMLAGCVPKARDRPMLHLLDSLHPEAVRASLHQVEASDSLVVIASKSGSTLEATVLGEYLWKWMSRELSEPGDRFIAITDTGSPLEALARSRGFRECFAPDADVGGRFSALSEFGLLPAAITGVPIGRVLEEARAMARRCGPEPEAVESPGLRLGAELGELAGAGRNKLVLLATPTLRPLLPWLEQLVAESLGKSGKGLVPVLDEPRALEAFGRKDRVVAYVDLRGEEEEELDARLARLEALGEPAIAVDLRRPIAVGAEVVRWEIAVAGAAAILGVNPFDQPDVEAAKSFARRLLDAPAAGPTPTPPPALPLAELDRPSSALERFLASPPADAYVAVQAFLEPSAANDAAIARLREALRRRLSCSTSSGYGPSFLHSTGQLHKGGPRTLLALQLLDRPTDLAGADGASFTSLLRSQADGDALALLGAGRRLLRVDLGSPTVAGLERLADRIGAPPPS